MKFAKAQNVETNAETTITPSSEGDRVILNIDDGTEREYELRRQEAEDLIDGMRLALDKVQ